MWCTAVLFNRVNAVEAASSETLPVSKAGACDETPKGDDDGKNTNSGACSSSVERSSS